MLVGKNIVRYCRCFAVRARKRQPVFGRSWNRERVGLWRAVVVACFRVLVVWSGGAGEGRRGAGLVRFCFALLVRPFRVDMIRDTFEIAAAKQLVEKQDCRVLVVALPARWSCSQMANTKHNTLLS